MMFAVRSRRFTSRYLAPRPARPPDLGKGLLAGVAGGLAGAAAMNLTQLVAGAVSRQGRWFPAQAPLWSSASQRQRSWDQGARATDFHQEPGTVRVAEVVSERMFDHALSDAEKSVAGPVVHFAYGAVMGGLYGAAAEYEPRVTAGHGLGYGMLTWLWGDLSTLPLLGLTRPHDESKLKEYVKAGVTHFVFGFATECVRRAVRPRL